MKLKRVTALGAVMAGLLSVPTTAMASVGGPPPPRPIPVAVAVRLICPPLRLVPRLPAATLTPVKKLPGKAFPVKVFPWRAFCAPQGLVFDMPAGGRTLTEVRGPRLSVHEMIFYRGTSYTVAFVQGSRFTLDLRGKPWVNRGPAIREGRAFVVRGIALELCAPRPPK